jgi:hypothetical protein
VYKISDDEYTTNPNLTADGNNYTDSDVKTMYEYQRSRIFGEKTSWSAISGLTGVSKYLDPDINSLEGATNPAEDYSLDDHVLYTTNGTYANWDNKTLIHFDIESHSNSLLIGHIEEDANGDAYISFASMDHRINNTSLSTITGKTSSSSANEGYIFGSEYQGIGLTVQESQTIDDDTYSRISTHGEFRAPTPEATTTNYDGKTATGFANANTDSSLGNAMAMTFSSTGFTGTINTGSKADQVVSFGGDYIQNDSAFISADNFAALNFSGTYGGSKNSVTNGMMATIDFGSAVTPADDGISWGIWSFEGSSVNADDEDSVGRDFWVASVNERIQNIKDWATNSSITTATWTGEAMGWIGDYNSGYMIDPRKSSITFSIDFNNSEIDASLNVNGNDFGSFKGAKALGLDSAVFSAKADSSNEIKGSLYDSGASSIGSFMFSDSNSNIATGVYKATKQ